MVSGKLATAYDIYQTEGLKELTNETWKYVLRTVGTHINYGLNPFEREWDVLIILDACRYDLFSEFAPSHDVYRRFDSVEPVYSCASTSSEWMHKIFTEDASDNAEETYYITSNGFSRELDKSSFYGLEEVWRYGIGEEHGAVPPEVTTNAMLKCYRNSDANRYIVHYNPPHAPFLHCVGKYNSRGGKHGSSQTVWDGLRKGGYELEEVWEDYGKNLLNVLDQVEILIKNVSGNVVVSADHANAIGEFGVYGHPGYCPVPAVKRVPWATATGDGLQTYQLDEGEELSEDEMVDDEEVKDHLRDLGYVV